VTVGLFLADKSALEQVRHRPEVAGQVRDLLSARALATCSVVALEVLYSARSKREYAEWAQSLKVQPWLELTPAAERRALEVQGLLAGRGQHRMPVTDLLIAAVAEVHDATVLHFDRDFERIAAVTGQPTRWIVPAAGG
jgi:predicted nucleic acid-binding protein